MTYAAALEFLYGLQKHGVKLGLERILALLRRLGNPQRRFAALHVGGTNGKGSTAAMAASILQAAGFRVGLYTSPHLVAFNERIRVNGVVVTDEEIIELTERVSQMVDTTLETTFFECTTAMAFQYFAGQQVDIAVVEVGMGGRFDATNVIMPVASAITTVALDHQAYLGETVGAIAFEKAGIIKPGIPVVAGRLNPEALAVIQETATMRRAPLYCLADAFRAEGESGDRFRYAGMSRTWEDLPSPLAGLHQLDNAACALAMLELVSDRGWPISEESVREGLGGVKWEGRLEVIERKPLVVLDGAHNPDAGRVVADYLTRYRADHRGSRIIVVLSMMRDKDQRGFLQSILPAVDELILTRVQLDRAATVQELREAAAGSKGTIHESPSSSDALSLARRLASPDDLICVTGSLMLVGEVKALVRGCVLSSLRG
ncbi:MAG TPA: folylpolyglutamate synthase/dihydrofolate synthase family protein [Nitrospiraceae bacterium]|nr:folylpolyglutamate synthase/dihydrofolate synthase family protein [Nitrospiraceae bacterium]